MERQTARSKGISIGKLPAGEKNAITDVAGVLVGHATIDTKQNKTGVTVIIPQKENTYSQQLIAASFVMNGYGKTSGLIQIEELGLLESCIALTNTLNVGLVQNALVENVIEQCEKDNVTAKSINVVVGETNDNKLNHITNIAVQKNDVFSAIETASEEFVQGDIGAGKGTVCFGLKGGIGSSSRKMKIGNESYTVGVLVQSNFGKCEDLQIAGKPVGKTIAEKINEFSEEIEKGSIMVIFATDAPVTSRQLGRILRRGPLGLARVGSFGGGGSGDVFIGFSTANKISKESTENVLTINALPEPMLDMIFRGFVEAVEEAVLNSLFASSTVCGYDGTMVYSVNEFWDDIKNKFIK